MGGIGKRGKSESAEDLTRQTMGVEGRERERNRAGEAMKA